LKINFLGTNGWFDTKTGNTVCTLIETDSCNIILDAGFGIAKIDRFLNKEKPTYLCLSHLHLDHTCGLHTIDKNTFLKKLDIFVPQGETSKLRTLMDNPYSVPPRLMKFKTFIKPAAKSFRLSGVKVTTDHLIHASKCIGYRFEYKGKAITYCTDTGVCDQALELARNTDLLITECALRSGQDHGGWPHLDPEQAATMAKKAKAKKLVMTHFDAHNYKTLKQRKRAQEAARKIFPKSTTAIDGMQVMI